MHTTQQYLDYVAEHVDKNIAYSEYLADALNNLANVRDLNDSVVRQGELLGFNYCPQCGSILHNNLEFCQICGNKMMRMKQFSDFVITSQTTRVVTPKSEKTPDQIFQESLGITELKETKGKKVKFNLQNVTGKEDPIL